MCRDMVMVSWCHYQSFITVIKTGLQSSTALMSEGLFFLPEDVQDHLKLQANVMNVPAIGSKDNYTWHSMQVNMSPAKYEGEGELPFSASRSPTSLTANLTFDRGNICLKSWVYFGGLHIDRYDAPVDSQP